jgi:amino-acid N-acetyltransferase
MDIIQSISKAKAEDKSAIEQLLESCQLPYSDLTDDHLEHFFVIKQRAEILGVVGLEIYDENGLLRSLAVAKENRGEGLGKILVRHLEDYASRIGIKDLCLLTTTADGFFADQGYDEIDRDEIPKNVKESEEFSTLCPTTAVAMKKSF